VTIRDRVPEAQIGSELRAGVSSVVRTLGRIQPERLAPPIRAARHDDPDRNPRARARWDNRAASERSLRLTSFSIANAAHPHSFDALATEKTGIRSSCALAPEQTEWLE
jgi:hypothetical protein